MKNARKKKRQSYMYGNGLLTVNIIEIWNWDVEHTYLAVIVQSWYLPIEKKKELNNKITSHNEVAAALLKKKYLHAHIPVHL